MNCTADYNGFEVGPIRPPSENASLLLRVTRNCPWNKCKFCGLYKGQSFSVRKKEDVIEDLKTICQFIDLFEITRHKSEAEASMMRSELMDRLSDKGRYAYQMALSWYRAGMESVFLQDANTMVVRPDDMVDILLELRKHFPDIKRVTSYGRAHTIARISDADIKRFADAGLNRIHIGMETGSDTVLNLVNKGVDKATQIIAGQKVKAANIELSEYFMPGLGGREYSKENAIETADALNQINPDFIRIRTLAVTKRSELFKDYEEGIFTRTNDTDMVRELYAFIDALSGITSTVKSDHILNLIPEVEGKIPEDKNRMLEALKWYLDLSEEDKLLFRVGRRAGILAGMGQFNESSKREIRQICSQHQIYQENADDVIDELMNRFI